MKEYTVGANSMTQVIKGETLEQAYRDARDQAGFDHGHGYSGSLSESQGVAVMGKPMAFWDAEQAAEALIENDQVHKWGISGAIPIWDPTEARRVVKFTVDMANMDYDQIRKTIAEEVEKLRRSGEGVFDVQAKKRDPKLATRVFVPSVGTKKIYEVVNQFGRLAYTNQFESQAKARAEAVNLANSSQQPIKLTVQCRVIREDGSPLVTVERALTSDKNEYEVTFVKNANKPVTRWYIAGVYSS